MTFKQYYADIQAVVTALKCKNDNEIDKKIVKIVLQKIKNNHILLLKNKNLHISE